MQRRLRQPPKNGRRVWKKRKLLQLAGFDVKRVDDERNWRWICREAAYLNRGVTSNHIHLLVADDKGRDVIPNSIKLIAG